MDLAGKRLHFMGIAGIGMSALAVMAKRAGAEVTGCDRAPGETAALFRRLGIPVAVGHHPDHVAGTDLLVYTSAVGPEHPERLAAGARQERRGALLARFMSETEAWGVSGTHGKTTTSWLLSHILIEAGRDPTVCLGGVAPGLPYGNYRPGTGPFVAELDESDESFLLPRLDLAVITNVESDHLSHYRDDASLFAAFRRFAAGVEGEGVLVAGTDKAVAAELCRGHKGRKLSFGFNEQADIRARALAPGGPAGTVFEVIHRGRDLGAFSLPLPGRHNVENALAALGAALEMGVDPDAARAALAGATGVERRLELLGRVGDALLYTDYAHHPTEVAASLEALRQLHAGPLLAVFQPHLYSRTRDYAEAFGLALAGADLTLLADIYPAREAPLPGVTSGLVADALRAAGGAVLGPLPLAAVAARVSEMANGFEAIVMMGAGDIDAAARDLAAAAAGPGEGR